MTSVFPKLSSNHTLLLLLEMIYFEENGNDLLSTQGSLPGHYSGAGLFSIVMCYYDGILEATIFIKIYLPHS